MNLLSIIKYGARFFNAPPIVQEAIDKFANVQKELAQRGYNERNLPTSNVIGDILKQFDVGQNDVKKYLPLLDQQNMLTKAMNSYAPGLIGAVKTYANGYAGDDRSSGDNGNVAATHNTITGRRKLPKIR